MVIVEVAGYPIIGKILENEFFTVYPPCYPVSKKENCIGSLAGNQGLSNIREPANKIRYLQSKLSAGFIITVEVNP